MVDKSFAQVGVFDLIFKSNRFNIFDIIIDQVNSGISIEVLGAFTYQRTNVYYGPNNNNFNCPNQAARYSFTSAVTLGPSSKSLTQYKTTLSGTSVKVYFLK